MSCIIINENHLTIKIIKTLKFDREEACYYFDHVIKIYQKICDFKQGFALYYHIASIETCFFISFLVDSESDNNDNF